MRRRETLLAVGGGKEAADAGKIIPHFDKLNMKYSDVVLTHGGCPGEKKVGADGRSGGTASISRRPGSS